MGSPENRRIEVHWVDIVREATPWISSQDAADLRPSDCYTIGWLIFSDDYTLVVAQSLGPDKGDDVGGPIAIPRCVIKSVIDLSPVEVG